MNQATTHKLIHPPALSALDRIRRVGWIELFFDLIFVAAIAQVGIPLTSDYSLAGLLRYGFEFTLIWSAWNGHTLYLTRFESDDLVQRLLTFLQIFAVAAMAANAKDALDSRSSAGFAAAYAVMRLILVLQYLRARHIDRARPLVLSHVCGFSAAALLWILAAFIPLPFRFWLWAVALTIDLATPVFFHYTDRLPPHGSHLPERFGLFTIILLGESVAAVMRGMESQETWAPAAAISALTGMALTFVVWWWYFDVANASEERHIREPNDMQRFHLWRAVHFPLYLGIAISGVGVQHVISRPGIMLSSFECWTATLAVITIMLCLITLTFTASGKRIPHRHYWVQQLGVASLTVVLPLANAVLPAFLLLSALLTLSLAQLGLAPNRNQ
jgi:low temperature requirement protein LtrA